MANPTYKTHDGRVFTHETLENAFKIHLEAGLIRKWGRYVGTYAASGTRKYPLYVVTTFDGEQVYLANPWEAHAFLAGLMSAADAFKHQAEVAAEAAVIAEQQREARLAQERERDAWVVRNAKCDFCGAKKGERCTVTAEHPPYAAHPHSVRTDTADGIVELAENRTGQQEPAPRELKSA